jgi:hypothetical protein
VDRLDIRDGPGVKVKKPRDIIAVIVVDDRGEEDRLELRGSTPEIRFLYLAAEVERLRIEWAAQTLRVEPNFVAAMKDIENARARAAEKARIRGGKLTAKKNKGEAAAVRDRILAVQIPANIGPRNRASHVRGQLLKAYPKLPVPSDKTIRKYLPKRRKSSPKR